MIRNAALALAAALMISALAAHAEENSGSSARQGRDILLQIADYCVDASSPAGETGYCARCPAPLQRLLRLCDPGFAGWNDPAALCRKTVQVWAETKAFVVIRDIKMCGCRDEGFVHGLVIPRAKVTGIEDVGRLPEGIWHFAWKAALRKIGGAQAQSIVLVVNPPSLRTQDQLHIHIVRLAEGARLKLASFNPVFLKNLNGAWAAAEKNAKARTLAPNGYGIALAASPGRHGYELAIIPAADGSPEELLAQYRCRTLTSAGNDVK